MPRAYVTNTDSDDISVVDLEERREIARITIGGSPRGSVRFDSTKTFGYVSNCAGNTVSVLDLHADREVGKITVGLAPRGLVLSPDGRTAFVSNSGENSLSVVDLASRKEVKKVALGENPRHMGFSRESMRLLVTQWGSDSIATFDFRQASNDPSLLGVAPVGRGARPYSITPLKGGSRAYVANTQASYLSVLDVEAGTETRRIEIGYGGRAVAITPDGAYAFASVENSNEVVVLRTEGDEVVHRLEVGPSPRGLAISTSRNELLASDFSRSGSGFGDAARNSLAVIDITDPPTARMLGHIKVGLGPCSVSVLE